MSDKKAIRIKWIGPNDPVIMVNRNNARLYITKRELVELMQEARAFTDFYKGDFSEENIDIKTDLGNYMLEPEWREPI